MRSLPNGDLVRRDPDCLGLATLLDFDVFVTTLRPSLEGYHQLL